MSDVTEDVPGETRPTEPEVRTSATILAAIGIRLLRQSGFDADVAAILNEHILVTKPTDTAAEGAKAAILRLASTRAAARFHVG